MNNATRIVQGLHAYLGTIPYIVSLRDASNTHYCGATIITRKWVVSTAICNQKRRSKDVKIATNTIDQKQGTLYQVKVIVIHKHFNLYEKSNNIALLQTVKVIEFNDHVSSIRYASKYKDVIESAVISGYGDTVYGGAGANRLRFAQVTTLKLSDCKARHKGVFIYDNTFCTFGNMGVGVCDGDFGGPVVANNELIGIASWAVLCGRGYADVAVRVSSYYDWIRMTTLRCDAQS